MSKIFYNDHLHDLYIDFYKLIGSDSWYFHLDLTF